MLEPTWVSENGQATLYRGDCLTILPYLEAGSIDAIVTDPPYGKGKAAWDENVWDMLKDAADSCAVLLKQDGICFWFASIRYLPKALEVTSAIPYRWQFIWYASNNMQHGDIGFSKYTSCLVLAPGKPYRRMQDLRNVPIPPRKLTNDDHPTAKPLDLMLYLTEKAAGGGAIILDPFMGSGTTGVACIQTGRRFIGIEIDSNYFEIAKRRIQDALAQPRLEGI